MQRENRISRRGLVRSPAVAPLSAFAGGVFVLYAFVKGPLTADIVASGWQVAGLSPVRTALAVHLVEAVPILVMALGLLLLHDRTGASGPLADAGLSVATMGFGLTIVSHFGEHLLDPVTAPAITGGENLLIWGYYLSWLTLYAGVAVYGLALVRSNRTPRWISGLFVVTLPTVVVVGGLVVAFGLFTLAGIFRLALGLSWVLIGWWLWSDAPSR